MDRARRPVDPPLLAAPRSYPREVLSRIAALCERDPGREACGFVLARAGALEVVPVANAADRYHAADPREFPRSSRDGYVMDPRALLAVHRSLDACGGQMIAVWHSHVETGATFSAQDRADALAGGRPVLPGVEYLVAGMRAGRVTELRRYRFDGATFTGDAIDPPET